jgi:hypothetical protein
LLRPEGPNLFADIGANLFAPEIRFEIAGSEKYETQARAWAHLLDGDVSDAIVRQRERAVGVQLGDLVGVGAAHAAAAIRSASEKIAVAVEFAVNFGAALLTLGGASLLTRGEIRLSGSCILRAF